MFNSSEGDADFAINHAVIQKDGFAWSRRIRDLPGGLFCLSGDGRITLGAREAQTGPGDFMVYQGRESYEFRSGPRWEFIWFHCLPSPEVRELMRFEEELPGLSRIRFSGTERRRVVRELLEARELELLRPPFWRIQACLLAENVLVRACRAAGRSDGDGRMRRALKLLTEWDVPIDGIAQRCCMSRTAFYARFRAAFGCSPQQCRERIRMRQAAALLEGGHLTIREVAARVGMDPYYFSHRFRRFSGHAPDAWRRGK